MQGSLTYITIYSIYLFKYCRIRAVFAIQIRISERAAISCKIITRFSCLMRFFIRMLPSQVAVYYQYIGFLLLNRKRGY
jgi:hypothetical protein